MAGRVARSGRRSAATGALVVVIGLALLGAGCSKDEAPPVSTGSSTSSPATSAAGSSTTTAPGTTAGPATSAPATTSTTAPTSSSTTTASTATTTGPGAPAGLILRGDGLGLVAFGTPEATAESTLRAALGDPSDDSGWLGPDMPYPGRVLSWPGLVALFHEGAGGRVFDGWISPVVPGETGPMYATGQGLARGLTYGDMEDLVGDLGFSREGFEGSTGICYPDHGATVCAVFDPPIVGDEVPAPTATIAALAAGARA